MTFGSEHVDCADGVALQKNDGGDSFTFGFLGRGGIGNRELSYEMIGTQV